MFNIIKFSSDKEYANISVGIVKKVKILKIYTSLILSIRFSKAVIKVKMDKKAQIPIEKTKIIQILKILSTKESFNFEKHKTHKRCIKKLMAPLNKNVNKIFLIILSERLFVI